MTLTETRPEAVTVDPPADAPGRVGTWLDTTDHKKVGQLFIFAALAFCVAGGVVGEVLGLEHAKSGIDLVGNDFGRFFSFHATVMTMLFLTPLWLGIATYIVPLQIGATRVALPRLQAFSCWMLIGGGGGLITSYCISSPDGLGLSIANPALAVNNPALAARADDATNLWILSLAAIALATVLACVGLLTTIATERADGMTYLRLPAFTLSILAFAGGMILATPVFLGGLLLLFVSEHNGLRFFGPGHGALIAYQHTLWIFGRPEIFLLLLPALGVACEIVATAAKRTLLPDHRIVAGLLFAYASLSFLVWAGGNKVASAVVLPTATIGSAAVVAPLGLLALLWLGTLGLAAKEKSLQPSVNLAWVVGFVLAMLLGGLAAAAIALFDKAHVIGGTTWTTGFAHLVAFGAPTLLAVGALWHWSPKIWGRAFSQLAGALTFLLLFGGVAALTGGQLWGGWDDVPAAAKNVGGLKQGPQVVAAIGGALVILGIVVLVLEILRVAVLKRGKEAGNDPYGGLSLEWATTSPPPTHNFESLPEIRSAAPLADLRSYAGGAN